MDIDEANQRLVNLVADVQPRLDHIQSEQDARFQLINRILVEVLGWEHGDIHTEPHTPNGYADYLLRSGGTAAVVVEAKKTGHVLVDTVNSKVSSYSVSGPAIKSAFDGVKQAVSYSMDHGADFAILTTGLSWIGFLTFPGAGRSYRDGKAIVFPDLNSIVDNFAYFFDLFAKHSVERKLYKARFAKVEGLIASNFEPMTPVNKATDLRMLAKSDLAQDLDPIFKEFFGVMSGDHDRDMLLHCFVETRESRNADAALQKLIGTVAGKVDTLATDTGAQLLDQIETVIETRRGENVLIVGNKGAGKSTFVERFFKLVLAPEFKSRCLIIRVDFLPSTGDVAGLTQWITDRVKHEIEAQLFQDAAPSSDELQGLYYAEYQKWRVGQFAELYQSDKSAFKIRFGEFLNEQINTEAHQYVLRLLQDVVKNRKLLPCFIFDNTDHHSEAFQEAVFQWSQSIRLEVPFSLVILPITDRTIWKMSKHGPFQTHESKLFYLPVPSTKEVLEKRIGYIKDHIRAASGGKNYFLDKGIRLSIENITAFAACTEEIFISEDFISRRIGWLSNHDIRRGLILSKNVITSPFMTIDELMSAYIKRTGGSTFSVSYRKFMQALVLGEYNNFQQGDSPFVINVFATSADFPTSPLIKLSVLKLLIDKAGDGDGLNGYTALSQIVLYLGSMGLSEDVVHNTVSELLDYRLVEPFDASVSILSSEHRVAVTHSGRMHYEMATTDPLYISQMAFATPMRSLSVVDRVRTIRNGKMANPEWDEVRRIFLLYCFAQDRMYVRVPRDPMFEGQLQLRRDLRAKWIGSGTSNEDELDLAISATPVGQLHDHVRATVKWFDPVRGFGFIDAGLSSDVFIHANNLNRAGIGAIATDDVLVCDIAAGRAGKLQVIDVHSIEVADRSHGAVGLVGAEVVFYNAQKGFGFVKADGIAEDVYVSASTLLKAGILALSPGDTVRVEVSDHIDGRGRAVRVLELV